MSREQNPKLKKCVYTHSRQGITLWFKSLLLSFSKPNEAGFFTFVFSAYLL